MNFVKRLTLLLLGSCTVGLSIIFLWLGFSTLLSNDGARWIFFLTHTGVLVGLVQFIGFILAASLAFTCGLWWFSSALVKPE